MEETNWYVLEGFNAYTLAVEQGDNCWMQTHWKDKRGSVHRLGDSTIKLFWGYRWDDVKELDSDEVQKYLNREVELLDKEW